MLSELAFDSVKKHFGYGLVRLSADLKLIDKNIRAEEMRVFPKRGANVMKISEDNGKKLFSLSDKVGDNIAVTFGDGIKSVSALAIREESGEIMLLMHPLISSVTLGRNGRTSRAYGINILKIIYGEKIERSLSVEEIFPFLSLNVKRLTLVTTAMSNIAEKLSKINFKNEITVNFEGIERSLSKAVDFTSVIYTLTELLSVEKSFSDGKRSFLTFSTTEETLDITLNARMNKKTVSDTEIFKRLFSEALLLTGVSASVDFGNDGSLYAKASVSIEMTTSYVREPSVYIEEAVWGYFDYSMCYYGFGEK